MVESSNIKKGLCLFTIVFFLGLLASTWTAVNNNATNKQEVGILNGSPRPSLVSAAFSTVVDISDDALLSKNPAIATDSKNNVHVVWSDGQYGTTAEKSSIYYKMYNYSTATWGSIQNISLNNDLNIVPDIAVDKNDNVHVVWSGRQYQTDNDIYYCNKTFAGLWGPIINVTSTSEGPMAEMNSRIAVNDNGNIQVIWDDQSGSPVVIKGRVAPAGNWGLAPASVTINSNGADNIRGASFDLAADKNYFHLIYAILSTPNRIYYLNSSDGNLQDDGSDAVLFHSAPTAFQPNIFVTNNTGGWVKIYTAWSSNIDGAMEILSKNATDNSFFGAVVNVTGGLPDTYWLPKIAVDSTGLMFVLYAEIKPPGNYRLCLTNSSAFGSCTYVQDPSHDIVNVVLANPTLAIDSNGSLHFAWEDDQAIGTYSGSANTDIFYRMYDRYPPHVSITSPGDSALLGKYTSISGTTSPDTHYVNVSYQVNGETTWNYINGTENDTTNFRDGWSVDWYSTVAYPIITIRANATDFNGASDEDFIYSVTIDAIDPVSITLLNIVDTYGNNFGSGDSNFTGTITITFSTADDATGTGVEDVTLYDGSTLLSEYGSNDTNNQLIFNTGDGVYSNLKLRATDRAGNYLETVTAFGDIRIDHTAPDAMFKVPLVPYTKFRGTFWIQVNGSNGDMGGDWNHVDFDVSPNGSSWAYLGTNTTANAIAVGADNIGYAFDTSSIFEDEEYWLRATVFDNAGLSKIIVTQIHVDNNKPDFKIDVDWTNINPVYDFTDDDYGQEVGIEITINVLCDNDTVSVVFYNKTSKSAPFNFILLTNTSGQQYSADKKIFSAVWNTFYSPVLTVFVKVVVTDDVGNSNSTDEFDDPRYLQNDPGGHGFMLVLQHNVPSAATGVTATLAANKTAIIIEWTPAPDPYGRNAGYLVFRIYYSPSLSWLNLLNPTELANYTDFLFSVGKNISKLESPTANQTTDYDLAPGTYFYLVVTYNMFGTVADINNVPAATVPGEQPARAADTRFDTFLMLVVLALAVLWAIIPIIGYSATRKIAKRDLIDFTMDVNVIKGFDGPKSFEKDVSDLDLKMRKELGMDVTSPSETEFLQQEIVKSVAGVEVKESTLKNCPQCGWVLSAGATKCIRCGYMIGASPDQSKEGKK